jgi:hypothetical protein
MDVFLVNLPETTTTVEILYTSQSIVPGILYDTSVTETVFMEALEKLKHQPYPVTEKRFKRYVYMDYEYTVSKDQDITVTKKKLLRHLPFQQLVITAMQNNTILPYMFPWSNKIHDIMYITRILFKIGGRLNLCMEARRTSPDAPIATYHVMFLYQLGRNHAPVDFERVPHQVASALRQAGL